MAYLTGVSSTGRPGRGGGGAALTRGLGGPSLISRNACVVSCRKDSASPWAFCCVPCCA